MIKIKTYTHLDLKGILSMLIVMLGMTGCVYDDVPDTEEAVGGRPKDAFSVSIALAGMGTEQTRGTRDFEEEYGTADENFIDIDDLYVMTFSIPTGATTLTGDSQLLEVIWDGPNGGKATDTGIYFNGTTAYLNTWLDSKIEDYKPTPGKDFCLVAIANFSQYSKVGEGSVPMAKGTKFSDLQAAMNYTFEKKTVAQKGIPLFGVKRVNLKNYNKEVHNVANPYLLESNGNPTLWMLRAFAKVEVSLSDALLKMEETVGSVTIESASLSNDYAANFWVIPELGRMEGFADKTGGTGQINTVPGDGFEPSKAETSLPFTLSADKKKAIIYVPEYSLLGDKPKITLSLNIGANKYDFDFDFKYYGNTDNPEKNKPYWQYMLRNHVYRFIVDSGYNIRVETDDWTHTFDNDFNIINSSTVEVTLVTVKESKVIVTYSSGKTVTLNAKVAPENASYQTLTWTSSKETVATVNQNGIVTIVGLGEATITATAHNGKSSFCRVLVGPTVTLSDTELSLVESTTANLAATLTCEEFPDFDKTYTWSSSNESVATVSAEGVVTADKAGTAIITATSYYGTFATCNVTVTSP